MFLYDFHVHLHGVLSAHDLWLLGKDRFRQRTPALTWYASEYLKSWGRLPDFLSYWQSPGGEAALSYDFLIQEAVSFRQFQACFNLIIALLPISQHDFSAQSLSIQRAAAAGLIYFEARSLIPASFSKGEAFSYLHNLASLVTQLNREQAMQTSLVFMLDRRAEFRDRHYRWLRDFCTAQPLLAQVISGIDFAGWEEPFSPESAQQFMEQAQRDNASGHYLDLLYHVGESFSTIGLASSLRWIFTVQKMGVSRLGHALSLGFNPERLRGKTLWEDEEEYHSQQRWLRTQASLLADYGYRPLAAQQRLGLRPGKVQLTYNDEVIEDICRLQAALASYLRDQGTVIECCPTSNRYLGGIAGDADHPLRFFVRHQLKVVLGSDDPGIFASSWAEQSAYATRLASNHGCAATAQELWHQRLTRGFGSGSA